MGLAALTIISLLLVNISNDLGDDKINLDMIFPAAQK